MLTSSQPLLLTEVTPSFVPLSPFGQLAQERKGFLDKLADIAEKAANVATVLEAPSGTRVTAMIPQPATLNGGVFNFEKNSIWKNPLFIAGAAVLAVVLLRR